MVRAGAVSYGEGKNCFTSGKLNVLWLAGRNEPCRGARYTTKAYPWKRRDRELTRYEFSDSLRTGLKLIHLNYIDMG